MSRKIKAKGMFSDRSGIRKLSTEVQYNSLDEETRINVRNFIINVLSRLHYDNPRLINNDLKIVYANLFVMPVDFYQNISFDNVKDDFDEILLKGTFDEVLDLIEGIMKIIHVNTITYQYSINKIFEKNNVGYRMIDGKFVRITSSEEIIAINESLESKDIISEHLNKAVSLMSDRKKPDYENSIKESITAVECICCIICNKKATLGNVLKYMDSNSLIPHKSLLEGFNKLYGYVSDANGIRHAGNVGGPKSTFNEAKYMLVSCCAFINYLRSVCLNN